MRITNRMITTSYSRNLNTLNADLNKLQSQVTTGRKFAKSSEDTAAAISAYQIRRNLSRADDFQENIMHAKDFLTSAESTLNLVHQSVLNAMDKVRTGLNGTNSQSERKILAEELRTIQQQMLQTLNTNSTGIYAFGGSNTTEKPFGVDGTGRLTYNGQTLQDLDPVADAALIKSMKDDGLTLDLGLGLSVSAGPTPPAGTIDNTTVFAYSLTGIEIMESGVDANGNPNNLYDQLELIATEMEKADGVFTHAALDALFTKLEGSSGIVLHNITKIGAKTSYLDFMTERFDVQILNMKERQVHVETVDTALTIINFETQKVAYQAAMRMGTNIIQASIFDFMD